MTNDTTHNIAISHVPSFVFCAAYQEFAAIGAVLRATTLVALRGASSAAPSTHLHLHIMC